MLTQKNRNEANTETRLKWSLKTVKEIKNRREKEREGKKERKLEIAFKRCKREGEGSIESRISERDIKKLSERATSWKNETETLHWDEKEGEGQRWDEKKAALKQYKRESQFKQCERENVYMGEITC